MDFAKYDEGFNFENYSWRGWSGRKTRVSHWWIWQREVVQARYLEVHQLPTIPVISVSTIDNSYSDAVRTHDGKVFQKGYFTLSNSISYIIKGILQCIFNSVIFSVACLTGNKGYEFQKLVKSQSDVNLGHLEKKDYVSRFWWRCRSHFLMKARLFLQAVKM